MIDSILSTTLKIKSKNASKLKQVLELETQRKKFDRSDSKITVKKDILEIEIFAKDIVALKATINGYINLLELIIKINEVEL